jgi:hypothetical protein
MAEQIISIPRANDRQVLEFYSAIEKDGFSSVNVRLYGTRPLAAEDLEALRASIEKTKSYAIVEASATKDDLALIFERGNRKATHNPDRTFLEPSLYLDSIRISFNNQPLAAPQATELIATIDNFFLKNANLNSLGGSEAVSEAIAGHHQILSKLEQTTGDVWERLVEARTALEVEYSDRKKNQDTEFLERLRSAEDERKSKLAELDVERQKLRDREAALDDRDNTHVRRDIRREFKVHLASYREKFTLTKGTQQLRRPIHLAMWAVLVSLIGGIYFFISLGPPSSDTFAYLLYLLKPLTLTLAAIGFFTWYLRWMTSWSDRHAEAEFRLKQLELDMDRASWVVETALEWRQHEGTPIPNHLLESVSRNLFALSDAHDQESINPVDQLASALLGKAARARLNIGGNQLEFERRALKKAGKG